MSHSRGETSHAPDQRKNKRYLDRHQTKDHPTNVCTAGYWVSTAEALWIVILDQEIGRKNLTIFWFALYTQVHNAQCIRSRANRCFTELPGKQRQVSEKKKEWCWTLREDWLTPLFLSSCCHVFDSVSVIVCCLFLLLLFC